MSVLHIRPYITHPSLDSDEVIVITAEDGETEAEARERTFREYGAILPVPRDQVFESIAIPRVRAWYTDIIVYRDPS